MGGGTLVAMKILPLYAGLLLAAMASVSGGPAAAHHSWSAEYDLSRSTSVNGTVARVAIRSPHSELVLVVGDDDTQQRWTIMWASPQRLRDRGVTNRTLRVGEELLVTGNPHRDEDVRSLRATSVRRSDGTEL